MTQIIEMVGALLEKKAAYKSGKNVYFDVKRFAGYGRLSHFTEEQMRILLRERGGNPDDPNKRNPLDFIIWQGWKSGEPFWETAWGKGRPGWHIECSAMIKRYLGDQIDIHGGGRDLIFPHHESEIAQSESLTGKSPLATCFMHTAMVMSMGEKMSKSLGNLVLVADLMKVHSPNAIRWMLLSHHYRQAWEYAPEELDEAESCATMIKTLGPGTGKPGRQRLNKRALSGFTEAMNDDLNTPEALRISKKLMEGGDADTARHILGTLGFFV
jgi:L-cysteine:1D-myo-inositol 2-amino-2-deoxy-alpha-D-glucopyranoside ligase